MRLEVELFCDGDTKKSPPYRIYVNSELVLERDFVTPQELNVSHYNVLAEVDLASDKKHVVKYESVKGVPMHFGKLWGNDKEIEHIDGRFVL